MRTLVLSDLHLGSVSRSDLLRRPELRAPLLRAAGEVDRVVLLGDVLELRHGPIRNAMRVAQPFFEELGSVLAGRELIVATGNHDHSLAEPWLIGRGETGSPPPLALEQLLVPEMVSPTFRRMADWAAPAHLMVAFPGLWVRPDVYAMHGHFLDCHLKVPTLERLSVGLMSLIMKRPLSGLDSVDGYESLGAPVFAWRDAAARDTYTSATLNGLATVSAWQALSGDAPRSFSTAGSMVNKMRTRVLAAAFLAAVAVLNRTGLGPLTSELSPDALRRAALEAMGEVSARLKLRNAYVIFGHTHRAGPFDYDDSREWCGPGGVRLVNAGSWTYSGAFLTGRPGESPYWPGTCVLVEDDGPPRLIRLLSDRARDEIRPPDSSVVGYSAD